MGRANLADIFSGQLLTSPTRPDEGCGLRAKAGQNGPKRAKILKNAKTCNLSNFVTLQMKKIKHKCLIIVNA